MMILTFTPKRYLRHAGPLGALFMLMLVMPLRAQVLEWAGHAGGNGVDQALAVVADPLDRLVCAGMFQGTVDFNADPNFSDPLTASGTIDLFVSWTTASGAHVRAVRMGGSDEVWPLAVASDDEGNCYLSGYFVGSFDADPGPAVLELQAAGGQDIFVAALDSTGGLLWAFALGGTLNDQGTAIAVDASGEVLVGGWFNNTVDFDPGAGSASQSSAGGRDAFLLKLNATGEHQWSHRWGSSSADEANAVRTGPDGEVYVVGTFRGTVDFDPGPGTDVIAAVGNEDVFVLKLDASGAFRWAGSVGGNNVDRGRALAVDGTAAVYVAGTFSGPSADLDPGPGTQSISPVSSPDAFLLRLDTAGVLQWAAPIGGPADEDIRSLSVNPGGPPLLCGTFTVGIDLDPGPGAFSLSALGSSDVFLAQYTSTGQLLWGLGQGGSNFDLCAADLDGAGSVLAAGMFLGSMDLDPGPMDLLATSFGANDIYIQKFGGLTTPVVEAQGDLPLIVSPNPAHDRMSVVGAPDAGRLWVLAADGRRVLEHDLRNGATWSVSALPAGLYTVQVLDAGGALHSTRVVKQ